MHFAIAVLLPFFLVFLPGCGGSSKDRVVLYCAQDQEFAEASLGAFTSRTGITVASKFDTEADKSVSLYVDILADKDRPRCDVFWNNEILNTIRLQREGLLEPYDSPSAAPYPKSCRAADHTWHAFAQRARILIVNKRLVAQADWPRSLLELPEARWKNRVVMAKPQYGSSATMAACLFQVLGEEKARAFYVGLKNNGVQVAPGNKQVAQWIGKGQTPGGQPVAVGITDTDDALEEIAAGSPVALIFPDRDAPKDGNLGTLFIPNTLAILRDCPHPDAARRLVDYLLSAEVEARLAESASHQIPLNPEVKAKLPAQMETPATAKAMVVDFERAADLVPQVQAFLAKEFTGY